MSFHENTDDERKVIIKSPMPAVWGVCVGGEFWWDVEHDRYCVRQDPHMVDLYIGYSGYEHTLMEGVRPGSPVDLNEGRGGVRGGAPAWGWRAVAFAISLATLVAGFVFFASQERRLMKVI